MFVTIGEIIEKVPVVSRDTRCEDVNHIFSENVVLDGVVVCDGEHPVGLVMKTKFFQKLSTKYGFDLFMQRTISLVMDISYLVVDSSLSALEVSNLAMNRRPDSVYDYVVVTTKGSYVGVVSIRDLLLKLAEIQVNIARYSSPLTGLPGNYVIEEELRNVLNMKEYSVFYFDINSFKFFNDTFGFKLGDEVITETAKIISNIISTCGSSFVGHIGGDDFIASVPNFEFEQLCQNIISEFDSFIQKYYSSEDLKKGYIRGLNRNGILESIPLVSLSIAIVHNKNREIYSIEELGQIAARVKKRCKTIGRSAFLTIEDIQILAPL